MPRPKGSKNKKKLQPAAQLAAQIASCREAKDSLEAKVNAAAAEVEDKKANLRSLKKELRAAEQEILSLEAKQAEAEALESAAAQEEIIKSVVSKLISSGKSAEEILESLNK